MSAESFDGLHIAAVSEGSQADAGELWSIVHDDGAGTAVAYIAAML